MFLLEIISYARLTQMLANHCFCLIHSWFTYICMVPMLYVTLDYSCNKDLILTRYKSKIKITTPLTAPLWNVPLFYLAFRIGSGGLYGAINFNIIG